MSLNLTERQKTIAMKIAARTSRKETEALRMLGVPLVEAYQRSFDVLDEVYALAFRDVPEPPLTRMRVIRT